MIPLKSTAVGFKEWLVVCDALGAGRQSIIVRKGGIAEGRGGFQWQRESFLLFPTHFHQQRDQVSWTPTVEALADLAQPDEIVIRFAAQVEWSGRVTAWETAAALAPFHVWTEDVVKERFGYGGETGLSVAVVRVSRLATPCRLAMEKRFGGCRSWVDLPDLDVGAMRPVLDDVHYADRLSALASVLPINERLA
ncbi:MAG: DUF1802 family protein [Verrucomicrobiales bacterium]